eukprot:gene9263-10921_t
MLAIRKISNSSLRHPVVVSALGFVVFLGGFAGTDYCREMDDAPSFENIQFRDNKHLAAALVQVHTDEFDKKLTYHDIQGNRFRCHELFYLSNRVARKFDEHRLDREFDDLTDRELKAQVGAELSVFAMKLSRRAMLHNGCYLQWFNAIMRDEFLKYYLAPIASFFGVRMYKQHDEDKKKSSL